MFYRLIMAAAALVFLLGSAQAAEVVAQGPWEKIDYDVSGTWKIVRDGATFSVELGDDFETKNGPDLHILLSKKRLDLIDDKNATEQALVVGLLKTTDDSTFFKKMKGAQSLPLPAGINLSAYRTILIHCVKFSHLWAGAPL